MNRGIINLSPDEQTFLASYLKNISDTDSLLNKLLLPGTNNSDLEISEEEAELMLDMLPPPQMQQDQLIVSCRKKLNDFLATFRQSIS